MSEYLKSQFDKNTDILPKETFSSSIDCGDFSMEWSCVWINENIDCIRESFVNLIPTPHGGTHVNAFKNALIDSIRNICVDKKLLKKNIKILPDDLWKD